MCACVHKGALKPIHFLLHVFIHSLFHSFIHVFIHSFFHSFIHSFIYYFIHSFIHLFFHSFIHSFIHLFIHSSIHPEWQNVAQKWPKARSFLFCKASRRYRCSFQFHMPANNRHRRKAGLLSGHRRRRWTNIRPALGRCLVFCLDSGRF